MKKSALVLNAGKPGQLQSGDWIGPRQTVAAIDPVVGDDETSGYEIGSRWINTVLEKEFVCVNAGTGAAVWIETTAAGGGSDTFFYYPDGAQAGNIYTSWTDLYAAFNALGNTHRRKIVFVDPSANGITLPAGAFTGIFDAEWLGLMSGVHASNCVSVTLTDNFIGTGVNWSVQDIQIIGNANTAPHWTYVQPITDYGVFIRTRNFRFSNSGALAFLSLGGSNGGQANIYAIDDFRLLGGLFIKDHDENYPYIVVDLRNSGEYVVSSDSFNAISANSAGVEFHLSGTQVSTDISGTQTNMEIFYFLRDRLTANQLTYHVDTHGGYGSSDQAIPRLLNERETGLVSLGYIEIQSNDAVNGLAIKILKRGMYFAKRFVHPTTAGRFGISVNSANLSTSIYTITYPERVAAVYTGGGNENIEASNMIQLNVNDVIRPHDEPGAGSTADTATGFRLALMYPL